MGFLPSPPPLAHQAIIDRERLRNLFGTTAGMGMGGEDNAYTSNDGLRSPMGLDKMEQELDVSGSKLNGMQGKLMMHVVPPSPVGETFTSHGDLFQGRESKHT